MPEDEVINMMISRSDDELELFKKIDAERKECAVKERLICDYELPDWLTKAEEEIEKWDEEDEVAIFGRGSRARKEVDYTDSLTEKEWLKAIDDGVNFDEELEEEDREKKRKGRKGRKPMKEDSDDESLSLMSSAVKRRKGVTEPKIKKRMKKIMDIVLKYVNEEGRALSEPFMKLPSKRELPDYYEVIKRPIDIKRILMRIEEAKYVDFADLEKDFFQLCQNAQIYNEEASLIYEDSVVLQTIFSNAKLRVLDEPESEPDGMF